MVRTTYREQLVALTAKIAELCGLVTVSMETATKALLRADLVLAERVIREHDQLVAACLAAEDAAFVLLVRQAPVAGDLRTVVTSIQNLFDVERMGVLAKHVAGVTQRRHPNHAVPADVSGYFAQMGRVAVQLGKATQQALLMRDTKTAAAIDDQDDVMDDLHAHLFKVLMDREWPHGVPAAIDVTMLGRFYERFADHAVEIGRRVNFQVLGVLDPDEGDTHG
jgi:phosphate transport system protein